ncbi:hypothetical protein [Breoghania sp.]|uniref:GNAT family N-acetyltransferase n=1 Tax=Breoghania sp. TaxID=2065378 RepID=UPI00262EFC96|nr:hypothetical protein [Breoghania sp.]MDJ0931923.1 hypothetical protein [Breoghania sp.]
MQGLREAGALTLSLVAEETGEVVGHIAASPARVGEAGDWFLIGPVAVLPARQGQARCAGGHRPFAPDGARHRACRLPGLLRPLRFSHLPRT